MKTAKPKAKSAADAVNAAEKSARVVRLGFEYGASHWFESPLGRFLGEHQLGSAGLTDSLIFMALALALTRSLVLAVRGSHARQQGASVARELAAA